MFDDTPASFPQTRVDLLEFAFILDLDTEMVEARNPALVGTGLALPHYLPMKRITGIDLSAEMLAQARKRVADHEIANVVALREIAAGNITLEMLEEPEEPAQPAVSELDMPSDFRAPQLGLGD